MSRITISAVSSSVVSTCASHTKEAISLIARRDERVLTKFLISMHTKYEIIEIRSRYLASPYNEANKSTSASTHLTGTRHAHAAQALLPRHPSRPSTHDPSLKMRARTSTSNSSDTTAYDNTTAASSISSGERIEWGASKPRTITCQRGERGRSSS